MIGLQIAALAVILLILGFAVKDAWSEALPRIREADLSDLVWAHVWLTAYYLAFVIGWVWILRSLEIRLSYPVALQAEMVSMLAKYIPGGVWTAASRVVAVRRAGVHDNSQILGSIALEAGLSAVAGVLVFVVSLTVVESVDAPTWPLVGFALLLCTLLHPRIFTRLGTFLFRPFGGTPVRALPWRTALGLLGFYSFTWLLGGMSVYFMLRSVGDAELSEVPYLGGAACVGAIVAVLFVFAPSGLGVREGAMYGLLLAIEPRGVALATVAINRVAITVVEAILLLGAGVWRLYLRRKRSQGAVEPEPEPPLTG